MPDKMVFNECQNYFRVCFGFALRGFVIGWQNSRPLSQSMRSKKPKPIVPRWHVFSRAWHRLHVFALDSDWFIALFASVVIGQNNYFGFGFTTFNRDK